MYGLSDDSVVNYSLIFFGLAFGVSLFTRITKGNATDGWGGLDCLITSGKASATLGGILFLMGSGEEGAAIRFSILKE